MKTVTIVFLTMISLALLLSSCQKEPVACTLEARICPDGSAVGRMPPDCEFAPCPAGTVTETPAPGNDDCAGEGQSLSDVANEGLHDCCEGLVSLPNYYYDNSTGKCSPGGEAPVCLDCGNNECGRGENKCNCPEDCR